MTVLLCQQLFYFSLPFSATYSYYHSSFPCQQLFISFFYFFHLMKLNSERKNFSFFVVSCYLPCDDFAILAELLFFCKYFFYFFLFFFLYNIKGAIPSPIAPFPCSLFLCVRLLLHQLFLCFFYWRLLYFALLCDILHSLFNRPGFYLFQTFQ